jgi:hypothetical protein
VPTTTKTKNSQPPTTRKSRRGLVPGRRSTPSPSRRPTLPSANGLVGRVQATLPGAKRNTKQTRAQQAVAALGKATSSAAARKPSTKSMLGILAGGVGAAAISRRRHHTDQEDLPATRPGQPGQASDANTLGSSRPLQRPQEEIMEIPKDRILQLLRDRGDHDQAQQAGQQLPDQVNTEQHGDLLGKIGINPSDLLGDIGGKVGL